MMIVTLQHKEVQKILANHMKTIIPEWSDKELFVQHDEYSEATWEIGVKEK
jgi:hypothetical protein